MIYFMNVIDWPLNIGSRPPHAPPANIPITFELAVLLGGGSAFFGFFALAKLPQPYHPVFESEDFRARVDRRASGCRSRCRRARDVDGRAADDRAQAGRDAASRSSRSRSDDAAARSRFASPALALAALRRRCDENILDPMADSQPKASRYRESEFFADGRAMRAPPAGTVPRERITLNPR